MDNLYNPESRDYNLFRIASIIWPFPTSFKCYSLYVRFEKTAIYRAAKIVLYDEGVNLFYRKIQVQLLIHRAAADTVHHLTRWLAYHAELTSRYNVINTVCCIICIYILSAEFCVSIFYNHSFLTFDLSSIQHLVGLLHITNQSEKFNLSITI